MLSDTLYFYLEPTNLSRWQLWWRYVRGGYTGITTIKSKFDFIRFFISRVSCWNKM